MPTIIKPDPLITASGRSRDRVASSAPDLLRGASFSDWKYNTKVLRSSFSFPDGDRSVVSNKNGFAYTVIRAWQQDLHLRLRPDDVWLAILAQFSFFVNGNAEALRPMFVAHEGQTKLVVDARPDTIETINVGAIAQQLAWMVKQKLKDPGIAITLLPEFTTTTPHDRATAAMVFLGTMQEYFGYGIRMGCSFPSVTLLGERSDWADMLERVAWFGTIDHDDTTEWTTRLTKVLEYMVASFDRPEDTDVRDFWNHAVHEAGNGSSGGMVTLSGWLTAFCWWGCDGKRVQTYSDQELVRFSRLRGPDGYRRLTLDGVEFPVIERKTVPTGIVRVPLTLHQEGLAERKATVVVGSIGMQVIEEDDGTTVQPASGWWMLS